MKMLAVIFITFLITVGLTLYATKITIIEENVIPNPALQFPKIGEAFDKLGHEEKNVYIVPYFAVVKENEAKVDYFLSLIGERIDNTEILNRAIPNGEKINISENLVTKIALADSEAISDNRNVEQADNDDGNEPLQTIKSLLFYKNMSEGTLCWPPKDPKPWGCNRAEWTNYGDVGAAGAHCHCKY